MTRSVKSTPRTIAADQVHPYCYRLGDMSPEAGAVAAVEAMGIKHPCDSIMSMWQFRVGSDNTNLSETKNPTAENGDESSVFELQGKAKSQTPDISRTRTEHE